MKFTSLKVIRNFLLKFPFSLAIASIAVLVVLYKDAICNLLKNFTI